MKFSDIRAFTGKSLDEVVSYLLERLNQGLRDLFTGLRKLDFENNFSTFVWEGDIAAAATVTVPNAFKTIPKGRIVVRAQAIAAGTAILDDSATAWTESALKLRNVGTANGRFRVIFFE